MKLIDLRDGERATVKALRGASPELEAGDLRRLGELGFIPGEPLHSPAPRPGWPQPLAVRVGDTLFALRRVEAECIEIEPAQA